MIFTAIRTIFRYKLDLIHAHGYESALVAACCRPIVRRPVLYSAHNRMGDELASYDFFRVEATGQCAGLAARPNRAANRRSRASRTA